MTVAVPFPTSLPAGYAWFEDEPAFDPDRHLQLETPTEILTLEDLGYTEAEITSKATPMAASSPFRLLSEEGTAVMLEVGRSLRRFNKPAGDRIERMTRGGCYRSRWLRDLCLSPELTRHLAGIYGVPVHPHAMPLHLGHLNYEPSTINTSVDKWHHDTLPLDFVLMVTDPNATPGGAFEFFVGTKDEAAALAADGKTPPRDRVRAPRFPGPGYAIALHGDMVVHRAAPLTEVAERITMVNGYVAADRSTDDQSRSADLIGVDDPECLWTEWAKFAAWRAQGRLSALIEELPFTSDREAVIEQLETSIADVRRAIEQMGAGPRHSSHYER
jgi:hypothetical protein